MKSISPGWRHKNSRHTRVSTMYIDYYRAGYLLPGFDPETPRTLSGALYNAGRGYPSGDDYQALVTLVEAGLVVPAPGCAHGWWVRSSASSDPSASQ